jgi:CTD kinase subunit beta
MIFRSECVFYFFCQLVEADRQRLLAIERLILETVCFNFTAKLPFPYVIKLGKELKGVLEILRLSDLIFILERHAASKKLVKFAWRIAIDW